MGADSDRAWTEELLAQRAWVERLARGLVPDPGAADDLVQDAWIAAMERPPRRAHALRPWLARVVANLARQRGRGEGRRARREKDVAREERLPDTSELLARVELQRRLAEEVLALDEPFRSVVLQRYFHGLSSAEIARRSGVPAGSVRSRLRRGLEELRRRLDAGHGDDRRVWSATLFALADGVRASAPPVAPPVAGSGEGRQGHLGEAATAAGSAPLVGGMLAMKGVVLATLAMVAVGGALAVWVSSRDSGGTPAGVVARAADAPRAIADGVEPGVDVVEPAGPQIRRSAVPAAELGRAAIPESVADPPASTTIAARAVDPEGRPLAGATIGIDGTGSSSSASGPDGRVKLDAGEREGARDEVLAVRAPGMADHYRRVLLRPAEAMDLGDVALARGGGVEGVVRDAGGIPMADVQVQITDLEASRPDPEQLRRLGPRLGLPVPTTRTASDGSFRFDRVAAGPVRVWAGGGGSAWSSVGPIPVVAGRTTRDVEIVVGPLRDDDWIRGIVLSPDGEPLAGMDVSYRYWAAHIGAGGREVTDESGRFEILVDHRVPHDVTVADPQGRWSQVHHDGAEPGPDELVFRFEAPRWMELGVVDDHGEPVESFQVEARSTDPDSVGLYGWVEGTRHPGGLARLMLPTRPFQLVVTARGFEVWRQGPLGPESAPEAVLVELGPLPGFVGRVVDPDGNPMEGVDVRLCELYGPEMLVLHSGFRTLESVEWAEATTTDPAGVFTLYARKQGTYVVRAEAPGFAPTVVGPVEHGPDHARSGLEVRMSCGGSIEGRVLVPPGDGAAGFIVGISRGDDMPRSKRVEADGSYRFDQLTPGPWEVRLIEKQIDPDRQTAFFGQGDGEDVDWSCEVFEGQVTFHDIDLRDREPAVLVGSFRLGDREFSGWTARLESVIGSVVDAAAATPVSRDGRFRLEAEPGEYRLVVSGPALSAGRLEIRENVEIGPGERRWEFDREAGRLSGEGAPVARGTETFLEYVWGEDWGDDVHAIVRIVPDDEGCFMLPIVPSGPALIRRVTPTSAQLPSRWETAVTFEVAPGETEHVRIR